MKWVSHLVAKGFGSDNIVAINATSRRLGTLTSVEGSTGGVAGPGERGRGSRPCPGSWQSLSSLQRLARGAGGASDQLMPKAGKMQRGQSHLGEASTDLGVRVRKEIRNVGSSSNHNHGDASLTTSVFRFSEGPSGEREWLQGGGEGLFSLQPG